VNSAVEFSRGNIVIIFVLWVWGSVVLKHGSIDAEVEEVIQQLVGSVEPLRGTFPPEPLSVGLCHIAGLLVVLREKRKPFIVLPKFVPLHNAILPDLIDAFRRSFSNAAGPTSSPGRLVLSIALLV
jgi:hypothetical protein